MKKLLLSVTLFFCGIASFGQTLEESVVRQFGNNLRDWCFTKDIDFRQKAQDQCIEACRVKNKIMEDFGRNSGLNIRDYVIPNYLNGFQDALRKGVLNISISNVRTVTKSEQAYSSSRATVEQEAQRSRNFTTVACDFVINGALTYHVQDLYYIRKGHIVKITPYEEVIDQITGKKKVKVDFSDLVDEHSFEVSYGYSSQFPMNLAVSTNFSYFNIGIEYGMNFSDEFLSHRTYTNFATSDLEAGRHWYLMATPGVFLRYATIDCGLGAVFAKYKYSYESVYTSTSFDEKRTYFIMKPKVTVNIPIPFKNEKLYITPHVGYQYVPKCTSLNSLEFGIGVRFRFETY